MGGESYKKIEVKTINIPGFGSYTGPIKIIPSNFKGSPHSSMSPAKGIKLGSKRPTGAKGGYFGKKIRKPQKK